MSIRLDDVQVACGEEDQIADNHTDSTDDNTDLHHVFLLNEVGGICQGIGWGRDRQEHSTTATNLLPIAVHTTTRIGMSKAAVAEWEIRLDRP